MTLGFASLAIAVLTITPVHAADHHSLNHSPGHSPEHSPEHSKSHSIHNPVPANRSQSKTLDRGSEVRVYNLKGKAWLKKGGNKLPLKVGQILTTGDLISSDAGAKLQLTIGRDVASYMEDEGQAKFELVDGKDWVVTLDQGSILSVVKNPEKRPEHFRIRTKSATMGVRGTIFYVKSMPKHPLFLCTCYGKVAVTSKEGTFELNGDRHNIPKEILEDSGKVTEAKIKHEHFDKDAGDLQKVLESI